MKHTVQQVSDHAARNEWAPNSTGDTDHIIAAVPNSTDAMQSTFDPSSIVGTKVELCHDAVEARARDALFRERLNAADKPSNRKPTQIQYNFYQVI